MEKQFLGVDREKSQRLSTSTNFACFILNRCVFPIAAGLKMRLDLGDKETLTGYVKNLDAMRSDYIGNAVNGVENPALKRVAKDVTGKQWDEIAGQYPLPNPDIVRDVVDDALRYVSIVGTSVDVAKAVANEKAIKEASAIYATEEDSKKKAELEELCKALNRVFNGAGNFFSQYILLNNGKFTPNPKATIFKPLIYGK